MKRLVRIAVLDMNAGQPNEGMRCIRSLVEGFLAGDDVDGVYKVFEVRVEKQLPEVAEYDIFICSGGPGSPKDQGEAWQKAFNTFLEEVKAHNTSEEYKKHLFLICHSFQLACQHWQLAKITKRRSMAFGVMPVHKTPQGKEEPLLKDLDDPFYAVDSREYQVVEVRQKRMKEFGAKVLCREKERPKVPLERAVMAIRFSDEIFGVQFHPEADADGMHTHFQKKEKQQLIIKHKGEEKFREMLLHLRDEDKISKTHGILIPQFLRNATDAIIQSKFVSA
ncbi:type 1 glutamine amidotransferase [Zeaxanthinibacter enoshimensis]|uniref:type 1 glutamine amidotransferase n=1 Tax=Zeaxanthinibacter enoshimensis TaxID=392009 RepID=UPI0035667F4B